MFTFMLNFCLCFITVVVARVSDVSFGKVIYAINAGGDEFTDSYGIKYDKDPNKVGTASDFGKQLGVGRVPPSDAILYQTERYHSSTFGYDISINEDGDYVLVLKFCEVYFDQPNMKVFSVIMNGDHLIVPRLDIFLRAGKNNAHDEYVSFSVRQGRIYYNGEESEIIGGKIKVEFIKEKEDNPKINAIYVLKGKVEDIPKLPPVELMDTEMRDDMSMEERPSSPSKSKHVSGPASPSPYSADDNSLIMPLFVALAAFIPLVLCLCRL